MILSTERRLPAIRAMILAAATLAAPVSIAHAQAADPSADLGASAAAIDRLLSEGRGLEAAQAARHFLHAVTARAGFGVTNARLTVTPAEGFGMFQPRPDNVYAIDEPVHAYVEVYGFTITPVDPGVNRLLFDVAFTLDDAEGRQMTEQMIPMGEVRLDSFSQPIDGFFHLTYRVTGATGAFTLRTEVIDRASGQRAEFRLPVVFADPPATRGSAGDSGK